MVRTNLVSVIGLFISLSIVGVSVGETEQSVFWVTADLLNIEWKQGCLTTAGCAEPRFKLIKTNVVNDQKTSISWPVSEKLSQHNSRSFTSHWGEGAADDISIACEVVGVDPKYKFPRVCDSTSDTRIFAVSFNKSRIISQSSNEENGKMMVELHGKCFNATLGLQKHEERCPWCKEHNDVAIVEQYAYPEESVTWLQRLERCDPFVISTLLLAAISIISTALLLHRCASFYRLKQASSKYNKKCRLYHEPPSRIIHPLRIDETEETKYEIPWENQQYHPVPYYRLGNRSEGAVTSPVDSSLTNATTVSDYGFPPKSTFTNNRRFSPSSSFQGRHDDSGLESV